MTPRKRLLTILAITFLVLGAAVGFLAGRVQKWNERGWTGGLYSPVFPGQKPTGRAARYQAQPGQVLMTYGGSPSDGRLLHGDTVVAINGIPIEDTVRLRALDEQLPRDAKLTFRVLRNGKRVDVPLFFASPLRSPYVVLRTIIAIVVAAVFITVALIVFVRRPDDRRATVFYAFSLVSAVAMLGSCATVFENAGGRGIVATFGFSTIPSLILFTFTAAYAPLILHLSLIFPKERPIVGKHPHLIRWIYAGAELAALLIMSMAVLTMWLLQSNADGRTAAYEFGYNMSRVALLLTVGGILVALQVIWAGRREGLVRAFASRPFRGVFGLFGLFIGIISLVGTYGLKKVAVVAAVGAVLIPILILGSYPILACVALVRSYRSAGVEEKRQVQWPLWGLLIALLVKIAATAGAMILGFALSLMQQSMIAWRVLFQSLDLVPTIITLVVPLSFAAAILKYRLMNIDVIIRKTVGYAILSGTIIVFYLGVVGGLGTLLVNVAGVKNQTLVVASTLVVALLFIPLRNKLQALVDRNLFRHKYDYPEALLAITAETRTATDAGAFLASASEKLQRALQNRAVVMFVERQDELVATAKVGVSDNFLGRLSIPKSFASELLDRAFDPRRRTLPAEAAAALAKVEAVLVVPTGSRGFMALGPKLSGGQFDVEDIDFLRTASDQISTGIDRIRMQVEEEDFAQAREIQQTLLPREVPRVAKLDLSGFWQPARTMGGDYYDLLKLTEHELAICIGDVAGKGMPAALLMSGLQAAVRASASNSPRDLCERVRRVVVSSLSGGRFVTFFYATLDTEAMRLRWCNAGHNAPILARADGSVVRLAEGGPAFSRLFRGAYEERELALLPGDRLVLFTDGVSEAGDPAAELFGEQRIEDLVVASGELGAAELQRAIVEAAVSFSGGELEDDLTLVVAAVAG